MLSLSEGISLCKRQGESNQEWARTYHYLIGRPSNDRFFLILLRGRNWLTVFSRLLVRLRASQLCC